MPIPQVYVSGGERNLQQYRFAAARSITLTGVDVHLIHILSNHPPTSSHINKDAQLHARVLEQWLAGSSSLLQRLYSFTNRT